MNVNCIFLAGAVVLAGTALFVDPVLANCGAGGCPVGEQPKLQSQTKCPVMGGKIDKNKFVDVKGYRVYVCCPACIPAIEKEPDKYLAKIRENGEEPVSLAKVQPATIETSALAVLVKSGVPLVLLDARTGKSNDGRRVPGAKQLGPNATAEEASALIKAKDSLVVTYCANLKCPASEHLAKRLKELGYTNILEYPQGIEGWVKAGLSVENTK